MHAFLGLCMLTGDQGMRGLLLVLQRTHTWPGLAHQLRNHPALSHGACSPATVTCRARCCAGMAEAAALPASSVTVLEGKADSYDGVLIDAARLPASKGEFAQCLLHSLEVCMQSCCFPGLRFSLHKHVSNSCALQVWRSQGRRGIWLRVPIEKAAYIEPAVAAGFVFHHAEPSYIMCTHWLSLDPNKLPPNASHQATALTSLHANYEPV